MLAFLPLIWNWIGGNKLLIIAGIALVAVIAVGIQQLRVLSAERDVAEMTAERDSARAAVRAWRGATERAIAANQATLETLAAYQLEVERLRAAEQAAVESMHAAQRAKAKIREEIAHVPPELDGPVDPFIARLLIGLRGTGAAPPAASGGAADPGAGDSAIAAALPGGAGHPATAHPDEAAGGGFAE